MLKVARIITFTTAGFMVMIGLMFLALSLRRGMDELDTLLWLEALGMPFLAIIGSFLTFRLQKIGGLTVFGAGAGLMALALFGGFEVKYLNVAFGILIAFSGIVMVFSKQK